MNLPDRFIHNMKELLAEDYPAWRDSLLCVPNTGIRVNELKIKKEDFLALWKKCGGDSLTEIPWIHNGFFTNNTSVFSGHPLYQAGLFYIQEPSAMAPAENLPVDIGDRVLDLCAAPGGKSTELLSKLGGMGLLFSNDISASRAAALRKNLELAGAVNAFVTAESPEKLSGYFREYFDKILVDAPCSGEGMFRREADMTHAWEEKGPSYYAGIQAGILDQAVHMLKPGGYLMYSTCTFSVQENEANVLALLDRFPDMELVDIEEQDGFAHGVLPGSEQCVRIYPHRMRGEGQFLSLMRKKNMSGSGMPVPEANDKRIFYEKNDEIYLIPEGIRPYSSLRYLMTGLHFGTIKKDHLVPSQALAEALRIGEWGKCLDLAANDPRTEKYLRGETIFADEEEILHAGGTPIRLLGGADPASLRKDGAVRRGGPASDKKRKHERSGRPAMRDTGNKKTEHCETFSTKEILILIEGYPVGFGVYNNGRIKNRRAPGRRLL